MPTPASIVLNALTTAVFEESRRYTATTFEANAKQYKPVWYEKGVWAGVEVSVDFGKMNFSVRVDNDTSPVYTLPDAFATPVINTVRFRVQAEGQLHRVLGFHEPHPERDNGRSD